MTQDDVEDHFAALAECCEAIVMVTDYAMKLLWASSSLERETGFTPADFEFPQDDNPFIHREDAPRVAATLTAFIARPERVCGPIENRFLDKWGRTLHVRSRITKIELRGEPRLLFVCHTQAPVSNVDERQYRALVESADDAIVRLDARGRFLFANARTRSLLGYTAVELGRLGVTDVVAPRDRALLAVQLARATSSPHAIRFETELVTSNGHTVWVQAVLTELGRFGQPGELLAILRDVSADHEVRATQRNEMLGIVVAAMARDIDGQLAAAARHLAHARDAFATEHLDDGERAVAHAALLCERLVASAEPAAPGMTEVDLDALVGESVHWMRASVTRRAALHVALGGAPRIRGNALQLQQLVMHVLVNASEAVETTGGNVTVATATRTGPAGPAACLTISDDGCGMDDAARSQALEPTYTTKGPGRGLGLAAAAAIARSHGGSIRVASAPGRGTIVEIELPAIEARVAAPENANRPRTEGTRADR